MPEANRALRVFLCHASSDKPTVRELYRRLDGEGWIDIWLDEEKLYPGQDWNLEIENAVEASDVIIVCLAKYSVSKEGYLQRELRMVLDQAEFKPEGTLFIIPVRLEECEAPRRLRRWQFADYFPLQNRDQAYERLIVSLHRRAESLGILTENNKAGLIESDKVAQSETTPLVEKKNRREIAHELGLMGLTEQVKVIMKLAPYSSWMSGKDILKLDDEIILIDSHQSSIFGSDKEVYRKEINIGEHEIFIQWGHKPGPKDHIIKKFAVRLGKPATVTLKNKQVISVGKTVMEFTWEIEVFPSPL